MAASKLRGSKPLADLFEENTEIEVAIIKHAIVAAEKAQGILGAILGWRFTISWLLGVASGVIALAFAQASRDRTGFLGLIETVSVVFAVSGFMLLFIGLITRGWGEALAELIPRRDFKYIENWRDKLLRTQTFLNKNEAFLLWLRDFREATEEETGFIWNKELGSTGAFSSPNLEMAFVKTGVSAVLHKLGVANNCVIVERPSVPFISDKPDEPVARTHCTTWCLCLEIIGSNTWKGLCRKLRVFL